MGGLYQEGAARLMIGIGHTEAANAAALEAGRVMDEQLGPAGVAEGLVDAVAIVYSGATQHVAAALAAQQAAVRSLQELAPTITESEGGLRDALGLLSKAAGLRTAAQHFAHVAGKLGESNGTDSTEVPHIVSRAGTESYQATVAYRTALEGQDPDQVVTQSAAQNQAVEDAQGATSLAGDMAARDASEARQMLAAAEKDIAAAAVLQQRAAKMMARTLALQREAEEIAAGLSELQGGLGRRQEQLAQFGTREGGRLSSSILKASRAIAAVLQLGLKTLESAQTTQQRMGGGA